MLAGIRTSTNTLQDISGGNFAGDTWANTNYEWTAPVYYLETGFVLGELKAISTNFKSTNQVISNLKIDTKNTTSTLKGLNNG
tara:strand:- start:488 stop:736 length:249 start_codon:yes stop_codon:yes gene_type:complete